MVLKLFLSLLQIFSASEGYMEMTCSHNFELTSGREIEESVLNSQNLEKATELEDLDVMKAGFFHLPTEEGLVIIKSASHQENAE